MNRYGSLAQKHWQKFLPRRYEALGPNPETFFDQLGEEIFQRVDELTDALAGDGFRGEGYMERLGRLNMARLNAESQALSELALLPEETEETEGTAA
jgi:hypothetical protein